MTIFIPVLWICLNGHCEFMQQSTHFTDEEACIEAVRVQKQKLRDMAAETGETKTGRPVYKNPWLWTALGVVVVGAAAGGFAHGQLGAGARARCAERHWEGGIGCGMPGVVGFAQCEENITCTQLLARR